MQFLVYASYFAAMVVLFLIRGVYTLLQSRLMELIPAEGLSERRTWPAKSLTSGMTLKQREKTYSTATTPSQNGEQTDAKDTQPPVLQLFMSKECNICI